MDNNHVEMWDYTKMFSSIGKEQKKKIILNVGFAFAILIQILS